MYAEYIRLSEQYQKLYGENTCVFLMVGKFYEMYDYKNLTTGECHTSMLRAVDLLNIQLSIKQEGGPKNEEGYFAGVPEQSLHKYAGILTKHGWTVVVCDQKKNPAGAVTGRPVARILSPATHFEANEYAAEAPFLACLWFEETAWSKGEPPSYGLVLFDLTTGELISYEGKTSGTPEVWSADTLNQIFQIYSPRELLFYWRGDEISQPKESQLRNRLNGFGGPIHIRSGSRESQGSFETPLVREDYIAKHFTKFSGAIPIYEVLGLRNTPKKERALIGLLRFVEEHIPSALENLQGMTSWKEDNRVYLGNSALVQLNMTGQRPEDCVLGLFQKPLTNQGKRIFKERILTPRCDIETLEERYDQVEELMAMKKEDRQLLEKYLRQINDMPRLHRKIETSTLQAIDVINLEQSYTAVLSLIEHLKTTKFAMYEPCVESLKAMRTLFMSYFDGKKARESIENQDITFLSKAEAPGTVDLEEQIAGHRQEIEKKAKEICVWASINPEAIRVETGKESHLYGYSCTNTTFNILKQVYNVKKESCPLKDLELTKKKASGGNLETNFLHQHNSKILKLREKLAVSFQSDLYRLCSQYAYGSENDTFHGYSHCWSFYDDWISEIDISLSVTKTSEQNHYIRPTIIESKDSAFVDIRGLRHPLIESLTTRVEYVKHNVRLDTKTNGWLVYGMNASGKSSLMKAVGVSVLLAQAGMFVPAQEFHFSPFKNILTRILNQDNLWAGLSSFAVEMCELRDILQRADPFSLVLGDELCSGTESISATALVASGIQTLLEKKSRFIFATHLHGLTDVDEISKAGSELAIWHLKVHYDAIHDCLVYDRTLQPGAGNCLYGLEVAKAIHLPTDFLDRAYAIRRRLLGEGIQETTKGSHWNSSIVLLECERCKKKIQKELEAHHIRERKHAIGKFFEDGSKRDDARNLVVLCEACHDDVHAGKVTVGPVQQTTKGPLRVIEEKSAKKEEKGKEKEKEKGKEKEKEKESSSDTTIDGSVSEKKDKEEARQLIESFLRKYPSATIKRIQNDLFQLHDITIHANSLSAIRRKLKAKTED